jgi:KaiC/GvpD/RAD55 family RecA-like ATPase
MPEINADQGDTTDHKFLSDINPIYTNDFIKGKKFVTKKPVGRLPDELLKFIANDSYSLLVKGRPGSGKTIFALTLMDNLRHYSNYFYISTRLSIKQLTFFYPWIEKFRTPHESNYEYKFEDARLDEPESLFERITNQLMDVKSPIIIIDTWDAIASFMDRESRLNNERVLQIWRERAGAKLIFLSESSDANIFDSMVDGVISLNYEIHNSKYFRKLFFNKLRGIPINYSQYFFTLFNGFFFVFDTINKLNLFDNTSDKNFQRKSFFNKNTVCKNNNDVFVELFKNKLVTLEFDSNLSNELILSILIKPIFCLIASNNLVLINNFQWDFYSLLKKIILSLHLDKSLINNILNEIIDYNDFGVHSLSITDLKDSNDKRDISCSQISLEKILSEYFQNKKYSQNNVLNVLDGNNLIHLISNSKFVNCIKKLPFKSTIIIKKQSSINNNILLSESNYYRITLKDNNVLLIPENNSDTIFGALNRFNNRFIDWYPLY